MTGSPTATIGALRAVPHLPLNQFMVASDDDLGPQLHADYCPDCLFSTPAHDAPDELAVSTCGCVNQQTHVYLWRTVLFVAVLVGHCRTALDQSRQASPTWATGRRLERLAHTDGGTLVELYDHIHRITTGARLGHWMSYLEVSLDKAAGYNHHDIALLTAAHAHLAEQVAAIDADLTDLLRLWPNDRVLTTYGSRAGNGTALAVASRADLQNLFGYRDPESILVALLLAGSPILAEVGDPLASDSMLAFAVPSAAETIIDSSVGCHTELPAGLSAQTLEVALNILRSNGATPTSADLTRLLTATASALS